jgi:hypothetical protein
MISSAHICAIIYTQWHHAPTASRYGLEKHRKIACTVLRGLGAGNRVWLPDQYGQQKSVDSVGYEPGPLSTRKEYNVDAFIRWNLQEMRGGAAAPQLRIA